MVIGRIKEALKGGQVDDKYEVLYYKYSQIRLENQKMKERHVKEMNNFKIDTYRKLADELIKVYEAIEDTKSASFKVTTTDRDTQKMLMDLNKSEKLMKDAFKKFSIEEVMPEERFYDPEVHEVASYEDSKGMAKGLVLKTVKRGFKFRGEYIKKPRVVVTK